MSISEHEKLPKDIATHIRRRDYLAGLIREGDANSYDLAEYAALRRTVKRLEVRKGHE